MNTTKQTGDWAETYAARYLEQHGVRIIARNVFSRGGEIDLIGRQGDTLVFFEVRFRRAGSLVSAAESITPQKQRRLIRAASYYLHRHGLWDNSARFDVIAIDPDGTGTHNIQWIKNAIQA
ncbi:YraN family protein [Marinobacter sp. X15-166B]|uniref:YraN family protein n=1 Tax=Marinobacter sp. X15-166B TaxID=1897620 RepID=UPI00085BE2E9|nr:YraN family protein [Marinobacter sp. X15-166B]OEY66687.1 YraN family protein [Marinobacter sp. X15-166B]